MHTESLEQSPVDLRSVLTLKDDFIPANKVFNVIKNTNLSVDPVDYTILEYMKRKISMYDDNNNFAILEACLKYTAPLTQIEALKSIGIGRETKRSWMPQLKERKKENID